MHVAGLGLSVLKGSAQQHPRSLRLGATGPLGDRSFCCVDPRAARVLRTVENPRLLRLRAELLDADEGVPERLAVDVPGAGRTVAPVEPVGRLQADYWGRRTDLEVLGGPFAEVLSGHLGREVVLARARPRDVVYGGGVTLVTSSSLAELARRAGAPSDLPGLVADAERWRATVVVATQGGAPFVEDTWSGRRLRLGPVTLQVGDGVARCAVVRLRPGDGSRDEVDPLALLAPDRVRRQEVVFGVEAEVVETGTVTVGDPVHQR